MAIFKKLNLLPWSGTDAASVTPHDTDDLVFVPRGVYVGTSGNLTIQDVAGETVTFYNIAAGVIHPISPKKILSSGTTASQIVIVV